MLLYYEQKKNRKIWPLNVYSNLKRLTNLQNLHETVIYYSLYCSFFESVFGLPCSTTCENFMLKKRPQKGFDVDVIQHAAYLYTGEPEIEASDLARALRYSSFQNFFNRVLNSWIIKYDL